MEYITQSSSPPPPSWFHVSDAQRPGLFEDHRLWHFKVAWRNLEPADLWGLSYVFSSTRGSQHLMIMHG